MRNCIVIFVNTERETEWAIDYVKNQSPQNTAIKILAPHFRLREKLKRAGLASDDYFQADFFRPDFYYKPLQNLTDKAKKLVNEFRKLTNHIHVENTPLIELVAIALELEFVNLFFAYDYLQFIKKIWQPSLFYFSDKIDNKPSGVDARLSLLPYFWKNFFLKKAEWKTYTPHTKHELIHLLLLPSFGYLIKQFQFSVLNSVYRFNSGDRVKLKNIDLLIFSAGFNLYYYHHVLEKINRKIKIAIVTSKQSPEDEYLLHKSGIKFSPLTSFWNANAEKERLEIVNKINARVTNLINKIKLTNNFPPLYPDYIAKAAIYRFENVIRYYLQKHVKQTILAKKVINHFQPRFTTTTHDPGPSAVPFVFESRAQKIPSIVLLHGWNDTTLGADHYSDYLIAWGPYTTSWFHKELKKNKNTLFPGGFPLLDDLSKNYHISSNQFPQKPAFGLLLTLFPLQTFCQNKFLEQLFDQALLNNFQGEFQIRVHRGQNTDEMLSLSKNYPFSIKLNSKDNLETFVKKSDVILSWDTTAIYYPMFFHKPLFYTTPLWGKGITPVEEFKSAWIPNRAVDIFHTLNKLSKNPKIVTELYKGQDKMLKEVIGFDNGKVSEQIAKSLFQIISPQ